MNFHKAPLNLYKIFKTPKILLTSKVITSELHQDFKFDYYNDVYTNLSTTNARNHPIKQNVIDSYYKSMIMSLKKEMLIEKLFMI